MVLRLADWSGLYLTEKIGRADMAKAIWNGQTIAESDKVETVEGKFTSLRRR
jgi:uncharacterized protein (DUF427 family)